MLKNFFGKIGHFFKFAGLMVLSFFGIYLTNKEAKEKTNEKAEISKEEPKISKEDIYSNNLPISDENSEHSLFNKPAKKKDFLPEIYDLSENETGLGIKIYNDEEGQIVVYKVSSGSPADKAGIRQGDILTKFNGKKLKDTKASELLSEARKSKDDKKEITLIDTSNTKKTITIEKEKTIEEPLAEKIEKEETKSDIKTEIQAEEIIQNFGFRVLPIRPLIIKRPIKKIKTDRGPAFEATILLGTAGAVVAIATIPMTPSNSKTDVIIKRKNLDTPIIMPIIKTKEEIKKDGTEIKEEQMELVEEKKEIKEEIKEEKKSVEQEKEEEAMILAKMDEDDILEKEEIVKKSPDKKEAIFKILSQDYQRKATLLPIILFRYNIVSNLFSMSMLNNSLVCVRNILGGNLNYNYVSPFTILSKHKTLNETEDLTLENLSIVKEIRLELGKTYGEQMNTDINLSRTMDKLNKIEIDLEKRYEKTMQKKHVKIKKLIGPSQF